MKTPVDDSYRLLACGYMRKHLRALTRQIPGVRTAEDIECVHRARVASRRLRAALRMFGECFPARKVKAWRKEIRRVTRDLGAARDKDVQIEFVRGFLGGLSLKAHRPGVRRLLLRLTQQRRAIQPKVKKAVVRVAASGVLRDMRLAARSISAGLKGTGLQSPFVFGSAERQILECAEQVLAYEDGLGDPRDKQQHHQMRIATKRLRYKMEACQPVYQGDLDEAVSTAKGLQTLLGEIHDCDVWIDWIPEFLAEETRRTAEYFGTSGPMRRLEAGIRHLRRSRQRRRRHLFGQLNQYWQRLKGQRFWDGLAELVRSRRERAEQAAQADKQAGALPRPRPPARRAAARGGTRRPHARPSQT